MTLSEITGKLQSADQLELYLVGKFIDYLFNRRKTNERKSHPHD